MSDEPQEELTEESGAVPDYLGLAREKLSQQSPIVLGAIGLLLLVICVLSVALLSFLRDQDVLSGEPTPTPFGFVAEGALNPSEPIWMSMGGSSTITGTVDMPVSLSLAGVTYDVEVDVVNEMGGWQPTVEGENQSAWVFGTIVNYVFGLPDMAENKTAVEQLSAGDEIEVVTQSGATFTFAFDSRTPIAVDDRTIYDQRQPGITIILLEEGEQERLVATGRFQVSSAGGETENVLSLGETAQLGDVQVTAVSTAYIVDRPELQPGFAFYMVDYEIRNVGLTAFDTSNLDLTLVDDLGNRYAINPMSSQLGNYPPLVGFLNANQSVVATAGYQIPVNLNSSSLTWVVTRTDTGAQVRILLPYAGRDTAVQSVSTTLTRADVSPDLTSLILSGTVTNNGSQALTVTANDVSLTAEDGSTWLIQSTNPSFPWTVSPGQSVTFFFTYQLPPTSTAIFRVLNQEFLLTGLR